ncbi:P-loop containing nucleoside triphosphate hydrolase protein, partial [Pavlovales sp. CCMP2436]
MDNPVAALSATLPARRGALREWPLVLLHLRKVYDAEPNAPPKVAVKSLSLAVRACECFGLLGVNGAGKTTTLKMVTGDEPISGGDGFVVGCSINTEQHLAYRHVGLCSQQDALIGKLSAREHLTLFAALRGIPRAQAGPLADSLVARVGLQRHAHRPAAAYSGGNKRKLCLAIALVGSPALILLDEPSSGMDAAAKRSMWTAIRAHICETGASAVITTRLGRGGWPVARLLCAGGTRRDSDAAHALRCRGEAPGTRRALLCAGGGARGSGHRSILGHAGESRACLPAHSRRQHGGRGL